MDISSTQRTSSYLTFLFFPARFGVLAKSVIAGDPVNISFPVVAEENAFEIESSAITCTSSTESVPQVYYLPGSTQLFVEGRFSTISPPLTGPTSKFYRTPL